MHYGATSYGLVHSFFELYGGQYSCRLLTSLGRLFTTFLQLRGFTLGVEDILLTPAADQKRRKILSLAADIGNETAARAVGVLAEGDAAPASELDVGEVKRRLAQAHLSRSTLKRMTIDHEFKAQTDRVTNEVNKACIPNGLLQRFPDNNLALMIQSGAKGSSVNAMQISCLLGQYCAGAAHFNTTTRSVNMRSKAKPTTIQLAANIERENDVLEIRSLTSHSCTLLRFIHSFKTKCPAFGLPILRSNRVGRQEAADDDIGTVSAVFFAVRHVAPSQRLRRRPFHDGHPTTGVLLPLHGRSRGSDRHGRQDVAFRIPSALPHQGIEPPSVITT